MLKQRLIFKIFKIVLILMIISSNLSLKAEELKIKSDVLSINKSDKKSIFSKNVLINIQNITIKSDKALVFFQKNASTPVKIIIPNFLIIYNESSQDILLAKSMDFDNINKEILLSNVSGIYENKFINTKTFLIKLNKNTSYKYE